MPVLKSGTTCYFDGFGGMIACKVISITGRSGFASSSQNVTLKVTAKTGRGYKHGEIIETLGLHAIPKGAVHTSSGQYRIRHYEVIADGDRKVNPRRESNPLSTISSGGGDGWQAAHAFRQLPDGRVQILTNPKGRVPKVRIQKNPSMTTEVYVTFSKKDAEQFRRDIAKVGIPSKIERHVARGGTQFFIITTSSADYTQARRIRESVYGHK
jgi:hypothetical protein